MNTFTLREHRHGLLKLAAIALPLFAVLGCTSASSGHAPGVAGGQTLTPGVTNFPLAYIKRPHPSSPNGHRRPRSHHLHHGQRSVHPQSGERRRRRGQRHRVDHQRHGCCARSRCVARRDHHRVLLAFAPESAKSRIPTSRSRTGTSIRTTPARQDRDAADQRQHHRRARRGRALSAGRQDHFRFHPPARDPIHPARRRPSAVRGANRRPHPVHIPAACHERRRHQHASDQFQHQSRFFAVGLEQRSGHLLALGIGQRRPDQPVLTATPTAPEWSSTMAPTVTPPARTSPGPTTT